MKTKKTLIEAYIQFKTISFFNKNFVKLQSSKEYLARFIMYDKSGASKAYVARITKILNKEYVINFSGDGIQKFDGFIKVSLNTNFVGVYFKENCRKDDVLKYWSFLDKLIFTLNN